MFVYLGQVWDDFTPLHTSIIILVDEQGFDNHEDLVHVRSHQVVQLVQNSVDDFHQQMTLLWREQIQFIWWNQRLFERQNATPVLEVIFTWSSKVGDIRSGKIWLKRGPAPNSLDLSVICLKAAFLIGGVPFFIFSNNFMIFLSFCSSGGRVSSSTSTWNDRNFSISLNTRTTSLKRARQGHATDKTLVREVAHQQLVKVLHVVRFQQRQVSFRLHVNDGHFAVGCLHSEAHRSSCHPSHHRGRSCSQFPGRGSDWNVAYKRKRNMISSHLKPGSLTR